MKYSRAIIVFSFATALILVACKTKKETKSTQPVVEAKPLTVTTPSVNATPATGIVTYETLKPLLAKSCNMSGCHDMSHPRINFTYYENFKKFGMKGEIDHAVLDRKFMPPDEKLTDEELALFKRWLADGMTEK